MAKTASRVVRIKKLRWLIENPAVWQGYPLPSLLPFGKSHHRKIFEAMQQAGLFSKNTLASDVNLEKLITHATHVRSMVDKVSDEQPNPSRN